MNIDYSKFAGKTVKNIEYDNPTGDNDSVSIYFTDGTSVIIMAQEDRVNYGSLYVGASDVYYDKS